jgi:hypothetical protein
MKTHDELVDSWMEEFRAAYEDDDRNAARQTFEDYWSWVQVFLLTGGAGRPGWLAQGEEVLRGVRDENAAEQLRDRVRSIGKAIAGEWAKSSRHRRIHSTLLQGSPNLLDWGKQLQRAAEADKGDGSALDRALDAIHRDVRSATGR